jgi:hypothetical protein
VFIWLADWWDGVELWIVQLPFVFQFALVIGVVVPLCWGVVTLVDRFGDRLAAIIERRKIGR